MFKTFASFSFGCRVNQAEKEMLDRQFIGSGFNYTASNPSIYIINTCAVTAKAEREARQMIYQLKRKLPKTKIVVTGCAATKWTNEKTKVEGVDWLVNNKEKEYIASFLLRRLQLNQGVTLTTMKTDKYLNSGRLLLKIQDGCQRFCTFCIVPYLRGQPKSRSIKYLVSRIKGVENEIKEVILTAINTQAYGFDTGESLISLMIRIIRLTTVPRISLGSIHPWSINNEFFNFYQKVLSQERLINFFHIPLQSGSNKILSLMKRGYTREEFIEKLKLIEKINPLAFIGTDIIVGFLEEDDHDFEDTYKFLSDSPISRFHIFRFNKREKTAAFYMAKRLKEPSPQVKMKRAKALLELGKHKYQKFLSSHIGKTFPALFLERRSDGYQEALLDNNVPILMKSNKNFVGKIKQVKITSLKTGKLFGAKSA